MIITTSAEESGQEASSIKFRQRFYLVQNKGRMMGDTINEYAGQIKTSRTEGILSR